jgi:hypothetical protein
MTKFTKVLASLFLTAMLVGFAAWSQSFGTNSQSTDTAVPKLPAATVILEVVATHFRIGPEEEYVYLRVFSNHVVQAQTLNRKSVVDDAVIANFSMTLAPKEFSKVQQLLAEPRIMHLKTRYRQRVGGILDDFTSWKITIRHPDADQELEVVAFEPEEAKLKRRPYPEALVELGCTIERVRGGAIGEEARLDKARLDNECKRVLTGSGSMPN